MTLGPIEIVTIGFAHGRFDGSILPELERLVGAGAISIVDGVVVRKITADTRRSIVSITPREENTIHVIVKGEPPLPDMERVYAEMAGAGLDVDKITVELIPA